MTTEPSPTRVTTRRAFIARSAAGLAGLAAVGATGDWLLRAPPPDHLATRLGGALHAGSEWKLAGSDASRIDYRGPGSLRTPTIRLVTQRDGSAARASLTRTAPVDLRGRLLRIWLRVEERTAASLRQVELELGSGLAAFERTSYQAVVLVDRQRGYDLEYLKPGEWVSLTICPASMVGSSGSPVDFSRVRDYGVAVSDDGSGPAALLFGGMQLIDADPAFPRGVVSFAFDDGLASPYLLAKPAMDSHGFRGTGYLIHDLVGAPGYMDAAQLADLQRGGWELALHADKVAIHNAPRGIVDASDAAITTDWARERAWLERLGASGTRDLALPKGYFDLRVAALARSSGGFDTVRSASYRSIETLPAADPLRLRTIPYDVTVPVGPATEPGSIEWRIDRVARFGGWLILSFHEVVEHRPSGSEIGLDQFRRILDRVRRRHIPVRTVAEVWASAGRRLDPLPRPDPRPPASS